ncbi:MAG: ABC transporter ATP-binding protein [bacterium]|nr:ABC transporter ATP-binding protein [bacterium]
MNKYKPLFQRARPFLGLILLSFGITLVYLTANIFTMPLARDIIVILSEAKFAKVPGTLALVVVLFGIRQLCESAQAVLMGYVGHRLQVDWRRDLFDRMLRLSMTFHSSQKVGDLLTRLGGDIGMVGTAIMRNIQKLVPQSLTILGVFVYLLFQNWQLTIAATLVFPGVIAVIVVAGNRMKRIVREIQESAADGAHIAQESLNHVGIVKGFVRETYELNRFHALNIFALKRGIRTMLIDHASIVGVSLMQLVALTSVVGFGIYQVKVGQLAAAELSQFVVGIALIIDPMNTISVLYKDTVSAMAGYDRVLDIMGQSDVIVEAKAPASLSNVSGELVLNSVSFRYPSSTALALDGIDLTVKAGSMVALVGASGAGKSTLIQLIPRFFDPTSGSIMLDGCDIRDLSLAELRNHVGIVPQESVLFTGTVAENLRYGKPDATHEALISAAKQANAWSFIEALPDGLDTYLGARGHRLSGGQRQRLSIARAILKDPAVLILDEATSSLDSESERLVQDALDKLMKNRTTIVIAHRLSTIIRADQIVVMQRGNIIETGTHTALLNAGGIYKKFYELQYTDTIGG